MGKIITLVLAFLSSAAMANPLFTPKQLSDLKATGRDIIVPKYLPTGFQMKKVVVDRTHPKVPSYYIWFVGPSSSCFVIVMGTEVGDLIVENKKGKLVEPTSTIKNPLLGETAFWNTREYLGTNWFSSHKNAAYMIQGDWDRTEYSRDKEFDRCKRMNVAEFIKVTESLDVWRR